MYMLVKNWHQKGEMVDDSLFYLNFDIPGFYVCRNEVVFLIQDMYSAQFGDQYSETGLPILNFLSWRSNICEWIKGE